MDKVEEEKKKEKKVFQIISVAIVVTLMIIGTIIIWPYIQKMKNEAYRENFIDKIQDLGIWGAIVLVLITAFQVILAFIPGEIVELMAGIMYGPWIGLIICLVGITLGCFIVYYLVKLLGRNFVDKVVNIDAFEKKWKFIGNVKRLEVIIFSITLIPGIPKDFIAFIIPFTKIKLRRYLVLNAIARIPSILSSTYFGSSILKGNYKTGIIIFAAQGIVAALGIIFNKQIVERIEKRSEAKVK